MDIPPRKHHHHPDDDSLMTSAQKFLPSAGSDSDSDDPYSSDHFRMYEFKVRRCTRSRSHDWTDCPFAHPGEKARRRDPRRHHYSGTVCPDYRRGGCGRGDACEFAHGVFECWLHPARYRTEACKDGKHCTRKVCFFAHTPRQLRLLHDDDAAAAAPARPRPRRHLTKTTKLINNNNNQNQASSCCFFCSNCPHHHNNSSPTSTLLGLSHLSPPLSPMSVTDLMEAMHLADVPAKRQAPPSLPWLDVSSFCDAAPADQTQFVLSPSTPDHLYGGIRYSQDHQMMINVSSDSNGGIRYSQDPQMMMNVSSDLNNGGIRYSHPTEDPQMMMNVSGGCSSSDPDLGWVNELLM